MLTHTGEKLHKCNICEKQSSQARTLKLHMLTHIGEKPYECNICGQHFTVAQSLKHHMLMHTWEKTYIWDTCGKLFTQPSSLHRHYVDTGGKLHSAMLWIKIKCHGDRAASANRHNQGTSKYIIDIHWYLGMFCYMMFKSMTGIGSTKNHFVVV